MTEDMQIEHELIQMNGRILGIAFTTKILITKVCKLGLIAVQLHLSCLWSIEHKSAQLLNTPE